MYRNRAKGHFKHIILHSFSLQGCQLPQKAEDQKKSRLSQTMLNSLMMITLNSPKPFFEEAKDLIKAAVQRYQETF